MRIRTHRSLRIHRSRSGQALIESAIMIPFVLMIIFNAINYGYFFYVAQNMAAAVRSGGLYSIMGSSTPFMSAYPGAGSSATDITGVANLVYQDMLGALPSASTNASVRVCSPKVGTTTTAGITYSSCTSFGPSATFSAIDADPEAPGTSATAANFLLNRIDVAYQFSPLIPGAPFGAVLLGTPDCALSGGNITCTFKAHVSMRAM